MAIAGLVLGIVGVFAFVIGVVAVVGLVLSVIALRRVKRERRAGFGLAVAGICLSALGVLLFVLFLVGLAVGDYSEEEVYWEDLERGDCVIEEDPVVALVVPCGVPHEAEVYAVLDGRGRLPEQYPGRHLLRQPAIEMCDPIFAREVSGAAEGQSQFVSRPMLPFEVAWEHGERWIVCLVERADGDDLEAPVLSRTR